MNFCDQMESLTFSLRKVVQQKILNITPREFHVSPWRVDEYPHDKQATGTWKGPAAMLSTVEQPIGAVNMLSILIRVEASLAARQTSL
jgi:hypothetical protein